MNERRMWDTLSALRDIADSRRLWEEIFPEDSPEFLDYYDAWKMKDNLLETRRRGGELISMIHWNPYRIHWGDGLADTCYVVAVATLPEYRHRGLMAGQLRDGLRRFRDAGMPFLFLMPAAPAIYEPFDFRYVYRRRVEDVRTWGICDLPAGYEIRPLMPEEWGAAARFMESRLAVHYSCYTERNEELLERTAMECRSEGGDLEGILFGDQLVGCLGWWGSDPLEIREMILSEEAEAPEMRPILGEMIRRRWPETKEVTAVLAQPSDETAEPVIMARMVNLQAFLSPVSAGEVRETVLQVEDRYVPENDGIFQWTMGPEGSEIRRMTEGTPEICISAADLTRWILGAAVPEETEAVFTETGRGFAAAVQVVKGCFFPEIV